MVKRTAGAIDTKACLQCCRPAGYVFWFIMCKLDVFETVPKSMSKNFYRAVIFTLIVLHLSLISGCGLKSPVSENKGFPTLDRLRPLPAEPVCRVGLLSFINESEYPLADMVAYKIFLSEFNSLTGAWLASEGDVKKLYQEFRIYPGQSASLEERKILASRLNVGLLIVVTILESEEKPTAAQSVNPMVSMRAAIIDGRTGQTLWSSYHQREGIDYKLAMHFGQINSLAGLYQRMFEEIITLWKKEGLQQCDIT